MSSYEADYYLWTQQQAAALRSMRRTNSLDIENLAEEIEDMGRSELNKVASLLTQIFIHVIKLRRNPEAEARAHWLEEIATFQADARRTFTPAMRQRLDLAEIWQDANRIARMSGTADPGRVPVTLDQLLDRDFDPEALV